MSSTPAASGGRILQRGGEEILVEPLPDRFTTRLDDPESLAALREILEADAVRPVARGQLVEWTLAPEKLEAALAQARRQPMVRFASHVYRFAKSPQTWIFLTHQITIQFGARVSPARRRAIAEPLNLQEEQALAGIPNTFIYTVTPQAIENPLKIANRLARQREVLLAEPNVVTEMAALYRPQDDLYNQQWHLTKNAASNVEADAHISVEQAWDITRGTRSVVIAVTDDGFDLDHPDLQGRGKVVAPLDLKARDAVPLPTAAVDNHGTACAGLAIGEENRQGIVGVAPGCSLMPIRTTGFLDDEAIEGIFSWAVEQGADVISCSWSPAAIQFPLSLRQRQALTRAATQGRNGKGCVIVFSAGNANRPVDGVVDEKNWPSNVVRGPTRWLSGFAVHPDVITVSACTSLNRKAAYSNWGRHIALSAPSNNASPSTALPRAGTVPTGPPIQTALAGRGMVTSDRTGSAGYNRDAYTRTFGGTSSSCPVVAGVAGLMLSANPNLTAREVKQILQQTADKITDTAPDPQLGLSHGTYDNNGHSWWFGYGRVNAFRAVAAAKRQIWPNRSYSKTVQLEDDVPAAIPDNQPGGITRSLLCRESGTVQDLNVQVDLEHDFLGDITVKLQLPSGEVCLLQGRTLGNQQQVQKRYTLQSTPALVRAINTSAAGQWRLQVRDLAPGHTGQLIRWQLMLALK